MASRSHRWPGDNHPLSELHGGTAALARAVIKEAVQRGLRPRPKPKPTALPDSIRHLFQEYAPLKPIIMRVTEGDPTLFSRLRDAQDERCYLCGRGMLFEAGGNNNHPRRASFDHVTPRAQGGKNAGNRLLAHRECNTVKADRIPYPCEMLYLSAVSAHLNQTAECVA